MDVFAVNDINVPNMGIPEMQDYIEQIDARVYYDYLNCVPQADRSRAALLDYLRTYEFPLYSCMAAILEVYQNAAYCCEVQKNALLNSYSLYASVRNTLESYEISAIESVKHQADQETPAPGKKRAREKKNAEEEKKITDQQLTTVKRAKAVAATPEKNFYAQEKFSANFPFAEFTKVTKKGEKKRSLAGIEQQTCWSTIYHVQNFWEGERLVEQLQEEGKTTMMIKKIRGNADQEMLSYKVISS